MRRALGVLLCALLAPSPAGAHGPIAPVASSYLARIQQLPAGVQAKVVDGDQRLWLKVHGSEQVVVLDYRGAPYLRFSRAGVEVNRNSEMYYLNQSPAQSPPSGLSAATPAQWRSVSTGHDYVWHDGRLHALAAVALAPGSSYVGRWRVPLLIDGHPRAIAGGLWHAGDPSLVWFWLILVLIACVLAGWRLRRRGLDVAIARALTVGALCGIAAGGIGRELYGRPTVGVFQLVLVALIAAFVLWGVRAILTPDYMSILLIAFAALWVGGSLVPTLLYGFVLTAVPASVSRAAAVVCFGSAVGLILLAFRLPEYGEDEESVA